MSDLNAALAKLQADLPRIRKADRADTGKFSYTFAPLPDVTEALMPLLAKHGLSFTAMPTVTDTGAFVLQFELRHAAGESITGQWPLRAGDTPQQQGSAISYARRYALLSVTGAAPDDDDDGAAASTVKTSTAKPATTKPSQPVEGASKPSGSRECVRCAKPITGSVVKADGGWAHKGDCP